MTREPLSIIVPALNEAAGIVRQLAGLQALRNCGNEVILVDGGSTDNTRELAAPLVDLVMSSDSGRAMQMNAGARTAKHRVLLFLHADTSLPANADQLIYNAMHQKAADWGRFDLRLTGANSLLRLIETAINWRSRLTGIATGDQAIFVSRALFDQVGGFDLIPLMEDIALSSKLSACHRPLCLKERVVTSSRRWEEQGIVATVLLMWRLRLAYFFGADPRELVKIYYKASGNP